jgi:cytochrome c biogenesis protein CcmG, thiol:disulfide interchange protein DsbE
MPINRRTMLIAAPLGVAVAAGAGFLAMLRGMQKGTFDPRGVPTMLSNQPVPPFELPGLGAAGFTAGDLSQSGMPVLVNFFASWCPPCVEEHPMLLELQKQGVVIWGIAYKDVEQNTRAFLDRRGDPFAKVAQDQPGRVAIDWGVTGVPESFLVDGKGVVRWHMPGPLTPSIVAEQLMPALKLYRA